MPRLKQGLIGLATCMVLAIASTPVASASEFLLELGKSFPQAFNKVLIELEDASLFHSEALGVGVTIECNHVELVKGELVSGTDSTAEIKHLDCTVLEPAGCELLKEPLVVSVLGEPLSATETDFKPQSGTSFTEVELINCVAAGKYEFTGSQICTVENGSLQTTHESECGTAGSQLQFVAPKATYSNQAIPLSLSSGATFGQGRSGLEYQLESGKSFPQAFNKALIELEDASLLHSDLLGLSLAIECKHVELAKGELVSGTDSTAEIEYLACVVLEPSGCGVREPIVFRLLGEPLSATEVEFKPESGTTLVEIELTACSVKGKYRLTGSQICTVENGNLQTTHELECATSGSKLKSFSEPATYSSQGVPLSLASGVAFGQGFSEVEFLLESGKSFPQAFNSAMIELEGASLFHSEALGVDVTIECKDVELVKGELVSGRDATAEIQYLACTALEPSGCGVTEPIVVKLLGVPVSATEIELKPQSGTAFSGVELTSCVAAGKYEFTGSQICAVENGSLQATHESKCGTVGSKLQFVASKATYSSQALALSLASGAVFGQG